MLFVVMHKDSLKLQTLVGFFYRKRKKIINCKICNVVQ